MLKSSVCTQRQLESDAFRSWTVKFKERPDHLHRKLWEWCFIAQALSERGMLAPGKSGLGFAVGQEPLTALFASYGCDVLATDLDQTKAAQAGWVDTSQHASSLAALNNRGICPANAFQQHARFRVVDMNRLPTDLGCHDFIWSSCSIEHLGSFEAAYAFMRNMTAFLKPGGVAVHTTEFNTTSETHTLTAGANILFRKRDLARLGELMQQDGHQIAPFDLELGNQPADHFVDEPPYKHSPHLKLRIDKYVCTSAGVIVTAGQNPRRFYEDDQPRERRASWPTGLRTAARAVKRRLLAPLRKTALRVLRPNPTASAPAVALGRFQCVPANDFKIYVDARDRLVGAGIIAGIYEPHVSAAIRKTVRAGDTVIDVGANVGYFTMMAAARVGAEGRVVSFEPRPENIALMRLSLRENGFENVSLHEVAVADEEQLFKFKPDATSSLSHVVEVARETQGQGFLPVRAVALDDVLADLKRVDVVKIDIDGGEMKAILGMRKTLKRCRPILFFEFAPDCLQDIGRVPAESLLTEIAGQGYDLCFLNADGSWTPADGIASIVAAYASSGSTHIDLVGTPKAETATKGSARSVAA